MYEYYVLLGSVLGGWSIIALFVMCLTLWERRRLRQRAEWMALRRQLDERAKARKGE